MIVNTASYCGFTKQYAELQTLWEKYKSKGLIVLGIPSNSFNQEKNSNSEIKEFCEVNFDIDFPLTSITVDHGNVKSNCYIIDKKIAYISDVSKIYKKDYKYFKNLKFLVIDCLWYKPHPSHFNLEASLSMIKKFNPKKAILTNLSPVLDYNVLKRVLPKNVIPAHDGLTINL